jgi:hypothetical protein
MTETRTTHRVETRFIKDGIVVHTNDLGYDMIATTFRGLMTRYGAGGWTHDCRTITTTVETGEWH